MTLNERALLARRDQDRAARLLKAYLGPALWTELESAPANSLVKKMLAVIVGGHARCPRCRSDFTRHPADVHYFCSRNCRRRINESLHGPRFQIPKFVPVPAIKTCKWCGREFSTKIAIQVFCGKRCLNTEQCHRRKTDPVAKMQRAQYMRERQAKKITGEWKNATIKLMKRNSK